MFADDFQINAGVAFDNEFIMDVTDDKTVAEAVSDYRIALKKIKAHPKNKEAISEALESERFFRSGWYSQLTSVDGEYLIKRLQDEVRKSESIRGKKNKSNRR